MRMTRTRTAALMAGIVFGTLAVTGCATGSAGPGSEPAASSPAAASQPVRVAAAASLNPVFDELIAEFTATQPGVTFAPVIYDGSSTLATQIEEGADIDVAAFADEATMQRISAEVPDPQVFATNSLVIVTPAGAAGVSSLDDLANPDLRVVLCAPEVPCGAASRTVLDTAGIEVTPASLEQNVTAVLTKVVSGEADAGLVYRTDAGSTDSVTAIEDERLDAVVNRYPIGVLGGADADDNAQAFVDFVLSAEGQRILADAGFGAP